MILILTHFQICFLILDSKLREYLKSKQEARKSKGEIRNELDESIINGEQHENKELEGKAPPPSPQKKKKKKMKRSKDAAAAIQ